MPRVFIQKTGGKKGGKILRAMTYQRPEDQQEIIDAFPRGGVERDDEGVLCITKGEWRDTEVRTGDIVTFGWMGWPHLVPRERMEAGDYEVLDWTEKTL